MRYKRDNARDVVLPFEMNAYLVEKFDGHPDMTREVKRHVRGVKSLEELQSNSNVVSNETFEDYCKYFLNETNLNPLYNNFYLALQKHLEVPGSVDALLNKAVTAAGIKYEAFDLDGDSLGYEDIHNFLDLQDDKDMNLVLRKLLQMYRLKGNNSLNKYFFILSDLKEKLRKNNAYKNIDNVSAALETLQEYNLIDCLEYQVKINSLKYKIWYLLPY